MVSKRNFFYLLLIIILCSIIVPTFFVFRGKEGDSLPREEKNDVHSPQTQFEEVNFQLYNQKKTVRWELKARTLAHDEKDDYLRLNPVEVSVFDNDRNEILYKFTAGRGKYLSREEKMKIYGPVEITLNNYHVEAGNLTWEQERDIIKAENGVKVTTPAGHIINGDFLYTDSRLSSLNIHGTAGKQAQMNWEEQENEEK